MKEKSYQVFLKFNKEVNRVAMKRVVPGNMLRKENSI